MPDVQTVQLAGGNDGLVGLDDTDFVGSEAGKTGLHALDQVQDLSLLLVPGRATAAVPQRHGRLLRGGPRRHGVRHPGPASDKLAVPPSGIIAGVYSRTDSARPGGVYDPPAGIDKGRMFGVLGFETDEVFEEAKRDLVYLKRINPLTTGPGLPRYIDGSRTLKASGNFPYVGERRGVIFIERSLKQGLQFARHKNNTEGLRAQVRRTITAFLLTQMNNGAFARLACSSKATLGVVKQGGSTASSANVFISSEGFASVHWPYHHRNLSNSGGPAALGPAAP